jgi:hypothetical protein
LRGVDGAQRDGARLPRDDVTDATAALGGEDAYEAMVQRYRLISHATLDVEEFLAASGRIVRSG